MHFSIKSSNTRELEPILKIRYLRFTIISLRGDKNRVSFAEKGLWRPVEHQRESEEPQGNLGTRSSAIERERVGSVLLVVDTPITIRQRAQTWIYTP